MLMGMSTPDHCELINRYVHVCNQALLLNKNRFPFKQILGAAQISERGRVVEVNIEDIIPRESFIFQLKKKGIIARPHGECLNCNCERTWNVRRAYLEQVTDDPQSFIQNPAKIDWEWMYDVSN